jgi:hypothetical protein
MAGVPFPFGVQEDIGKLPELTFDRLLNPLSGLGIGGPEAVFREILVDVLNIMDKNGSGERPDQRVLFYILSMDCNSKNEEENK